MSSYIMVNWFHDFTQNWRSLEKTYIPVHCFTRMGALGITVLIVTMEYKWSCKPHPSQRRVWLERLRIQVELFQQLS